MSIEKIFFFCDAPEFAQLRLQDPSTTTMEGLLEFIGGWIIPREAGSMYGMLPTLILRAPML